ncbi:venom allergen 5.02-like [Cylas formicarius]|uniref:venom allergen 5.02-like n=1 Tax=Cylas formicarius TaxID=197179 RepID=UPI002958ADA2|nr:venom allergen 5.02-like [Cylas formicarius]
MSNSIVSIYFLLFQADALLIKDIDWCKQPCGNKNHTVCKLGISCPAVKGCQHANGYDKHMRDLFVDLHNELRNKVALGEEEGVPRAEDRVANMMALSWDHHLEYVARCHNRQCTATRDECRSTPKFPNVGQNIFSTNISSTTGHSMSSVDLPKRAITSWFREIEFVPLEVYKRYEKTDLPGEQYTQVVWAKTTHIGCSMSQKVYANLTQYFVVCNYGAGGNVKGQPIFERGTPCSECQGNSCNRKWAGLCGDVEFAKKCPCEK